MKDVVRVIAHVKEQLFINFGAQLVKAFVIWWEITKSYGFSDYRL